MPYIYKSGLQFGINETNIYGGASYVELTQAEYDALSDAEKHNGQIYFITDGNYDFLIVNDSVPVGSIQAYGGMTAPTNWLICDGRAVSRTDYKELFKIIGVTYGEGDGLTTFNLPDLTGRVAIGPNTAHLLGTSGGQEEHIHTTGNFTLGINHIPSHNHNSRSITGSLTFRDMNTGDHNLLLGAGGVFSASYPTWSGSHDAAAKTTISTYKYNNVSLNATHTHDAQGGGQAHNHGDTGSTSNMQPYLVTNYIIKAKNPSITSGQQLQAMELFYPVGSYFETSDSTFDPNVEWGGTWSLNSIINEEESLIYNGSFSTGTTSLTNNVNNYNKIKILAIDNDGTLKTFEVTNENSNAFSTYLDFGRVAGGWYAKCMVVAFDGTSMTENFNRQAYFSTISAEGTYVTVKKVYGYKQIISYKWKRTA